MAQDRMYLVCGDQECEIEPKRLYIARQVLGAYGWEAQPERGDIDAFFAAHAICGIKVVTDDTMPNDRIEMRPAWMCNEQLYKQRIMAAQRDYFEQSQPLIRLMARVYGTSRLIMKDGEVISYETVYTPEQQATLDETKRLLAELQDSIFKAYGRLPG